jgi:hypothetical protein
MRHIDPVERQDRADHRVPGPGEQVENREIVTTAGRDPGWRTRAGSRAGHASCSWPAADHRGPGVRVPALPVARGPDPRFEGEQAELVLPDPEAGWRSEAAMIPHEPRANPIHKDH